MFLQQLMNGLTLGSTYSLVALGYTLIFGTLGIINMAHGDVFMIGSFVGLLLVTHLHLNIWVAMLGAMLAAAYMGLLLEYTALRPLRRRTSQTLAPLISTIGFATFIQGAALKVFGPQSQTFPMAVKGGSYHLGNVTFTFIDVVIVGVSVLFMVLLTVGLDRTKWGKAMRATAENREVAGLLGINANLVIVGTVMLASALGGAAGVLVGLSFAVHHAMGLPFGLKGLAIIVLGGMGNVTGAMVGGILLGFVEVMTVQFLASSWRDAAAFAVLFLLLIVRPGGLFGKSGPERSGQRA